MTKVYCKNCKYRGWIYGKDWNWCEKPYNNYSGLSHYKNEFNATGDCQYYKPTFWHKLFNK